MIINGLAVGIPVLLTIAGLSAVWVILGRDTGRHTADPLAGAGLIISPAGGYGVPEVHHDEYAPPSLHDGYRAALAMTKRAEDEDAGPAALPGAGPEGSRPGEGTTEWEPNSGRGVQGRTAPSQAAISTTRSHTQPEAENLNTPAGDQAPGPRLPEGDTAGPWPPQEAGPGDLPPMSPLLASALRELEDAERWPHLARPWADSTGSFERIVAGA